MIYIFHNSKFKKLLFSSFIFFSVCRAASEYIVCKIKGSFFKEEFGTGEKRWNDSLMRTGGLDELVTGGLEELGTGGIEELGAGDLEELGTVGLEEV